MDIFIEYAHEGDLPNNGKTPSGLAELNAALLKIKPELPQNGFGLFAGLLGRPPAPDPLPLSTERHAYLQKRSDEAKQQREDQRVIADAIRSGALNPPLSSLNTHEQPPENQNWVTTAELKRLLSPHWKKVARMCRNPKDYPWALEFRKPDPAYKGRYLWEVVGLTKAVKHRVMKADSPLEYSASSQPLEVLNLAFGGGKR